MDALSPGRVYLVGAGPGDPDLLTVKGVRCLREADAVLYDELLDSRLLDLPRPGCERIYVGKRGGRKSYTQEKINDLLVSLARRGQRVVRLKGGDPCLFGRGAEEALCLAEADIPFEIVPGVSAATAVPAYAGIPLTHRGLATTAILVTGHEVPGKPIPGVDWPRLAALDGTLVVFMGARQLAQIVGRLLACGRAPDTPVAVIERGTYASQRTITSTLARIAEEAGAADIRAPALIVIGQVVRMREQLCWFERRPLFGKRVLITRPPEQAGDLREQLEAAGAEVLLLPLLEIRLPDDCSALDRAIDRLPAFGWVVFASANAVECFFDRLRHLGRDVRAFAGARIAAVGQTTAGTLRGRGLEPDLIPDDQSQEGLEAAFDGISVEGMQILIPGSSIGRTRLAEALAARGAQVCRVTAYENRPPDPTRIEFPPGLDRLHLVVFASPSAARNFGTVLGQERARRILADATIACIGPTTAGAVESLGFQAHIQPTENSVPALVQAICSYYGSVP